MLVLGYLSISCSVGRSGDETLIPPENKKKIKLLINSFEISIADKIETVKTFFFYNYLYLYFDKFHYPERFEDM